MKRRDFSVIPFAYQDIGYVCIRELIRIGVAMPFVVTHKDDPGEEIWFRSVHSLCRRNNIPVFYAEDLTHEKLKRRMKKERPDLAMSLYYRNLLPKDILSIPRMGGINLHGSFLPYYRGRCPVNWAILKGEKTAGLTFHFMVAKPDAGDIIKGIKVPIRKADTVKTVYRRMTRTAPRLLRDVMAGFFKGNVRRKAQDEKNATYFGGRRPEDGVIHWSDKALYIHNLIRAVTHPFPGAFTFLGENGKKIFIWKSRVITTKPLLNKARGLAVGEITGVSKKSGIMVKTEEGLLGCLRLQADGFAEQDAQAFAAKNAIKAGDGFCGSGSSHSSGGRP